MDWLVVALIYITYIIIKTVNHLWLHPLAKIPGPKLAAATAWYQTYFELLHKGIGGQFTFHIKELHERYGPIVRVSPNEVHIDDPNYFSTIYTSNYAFDKPRRLQWRFGCPHSLFSTPEHSLHKIRRGAQQQFFSKGRVVKLSPQMQEMAERMCGRLAKDFMNKEKPVVMDHLIASYISDITTTFSFGRDFNYLSHPNFESPFIKSVMGFKNMAHPCTQFPWLGPALSLLPDRLVRFLQPGAAVIIEFQKEMVTMIQRAQQEVKDLGPDGNKLIDDTIMHGILTSDLPEEEHSMDILKNHASALLGAGIASSQWTLTLAMYHVMSDKSVADTLRKELIEAMPDINVQVSYEKVLQQLPYLSAVVTEAIRLACGQMTRSPRISKDPIRYKDYVIAPGTEVSLDTWHMHHNETLYPDSYKFKPERWLGNPMAPAPYDEKPLKSYMTSFGKGTRNCIGINLAEAEVTIGLAHLVRRFDWELWETTEEDVRIVRDLMAPDTGPKSKGIRAIVKELSW